MNATDKVNAPLSAIFGNLDDPAHIDEVIDRALEYREKATEGARSRLNAAIRNSDVHMPGFRDTSKAPTLQLRAPLIVDMMKGNDRLAGAVLLAWMESHKPLTKATAKYLSGRDIPTGGIDARKGKFDSFWDRSEWESARDALRDSNSNFEVDDIALMLSCVAGKLPEPVITAEHKLESRLFKNWMDELNRMDSEADDWLDLDLFRDAVTNIGETKAIDRVRTQSRAVKNGLAEIMKDYSEELQYLGVEVAEWPDDGRRHSKGTFSDAREFIGKLKEGLAEYRPVRPQAPTREQELERVATREEWEKAILEASKLWGEFITRLEDSAEAEAAVNDYEAEKAKLLEEQAALKADFDKINAQIEEMKAEVEKASQASGVTAEAYEEMDRKTTMLIAENEGLKDTVARLRSANEGLDADRQALGDQVRRLRRQLAENKQMAEMWRQSYEEERAKQSQESELDPSQLESVNDALELAEKTYPDQLLLTLNSKSDKNSPFQKPDEVFGALKWLATEYHDLRANPTGSEPGFNMLLKQSCSGWSYKPGQTEVTKEQFNQWYTTWHDGKTYELQTHIAKGTSHNPQNTIRIAFDWDDDLKKVVVGYLGLHQRNRRSA